MLAEGAVGWGQMWEPLLPGWGEGSESVSWFWDFFQY
jgi:hypothetical protein